jgi:Flp pilus assembly protein TadD
MVLLVIGSIGGLFAILYAVLFFRNYDRDVNKAIKLHNAGDKEGAIAWLKAASEGRRPSANRSNTLGIFSIVREDWAGAYQAFLEAEAIGGRQAPFLANQGLALWKLGRLDEAEPLLRQASAMAPTDPTIACNLGHVLADLGRIDDASRQLSIAEMAYEKYIVFPRSAKVPIGQEIAKLREKLGIENDPATGSVAGP